MAGALRFELRTSGLESDVLPVDTMLPLLVGADGLEPPQGMEAHLVYSQAQLPLCHTPTKKDTSVIKNQNAVYVSACGNFPLLDSRPGLTGLAF